MRRHRDLGYVDAWDFLTALGTKRMSRSGEEIDFSCPGTAHAHGDQTPSARMNTRTTLWICHGCGLRGDAVTYLTAFHSLNESEAQRVIDERYGGPGLSVEAGGLQAEVERITAAPEEAPDRVLPDESWVGRFQDALALSPDALGYMIGRGFWAPVLGNWGIGLDGISGRIAIPVRNADGVLVGFKGRAYQKYLILGDAQGRPPRYGFDTYRKSEVVFALDRAQGDRVVLCEGELNSIMLHHVGEHGAVSVAGSEFSPKQAELIIGRFSSAVVYFDGDQAGREGTKLVVEALEPYMPVSIVVDPPDDAAALKADALPLIANAIPALQAAIL